MTDLKLSEQMERALTITVEDAERREQEGYERRGLWLVADWWDQQTRDALLRRGLIVEKIERGNPNDGQRLTRRGRAVGRRLLEQERRQDRRRRFYRELVNYGGDDFDEVVEEARKAREEA